jgi:5-methylcytosine-specific restriction endonuclease McrA
MRKEIGWVETFEPVTPGPHASATLLARPAWQKRYACPRDLKNVDGLCAWCNKEPPTKRSKRYCSKVCKESANFFCYPQHASTKAFLLIHRQNCACARCGLSFEEEIAEHIRRRLRMKPGEELKAAEKVTLWQVGYETGNHWHVDHIVPIWKGGSGVGIDNVQVLCVPCHKRKTAEEAGQR